MAKSKLSESEVVIANILDPETVETVETVEWSWGELSRYQLVGEYPAWYEPTQPIKTDEETQS